ncbi:hypothetical protein Tco_0483388 [Tanacetum coccineum]
MKEFATIDQAIYYSEITSFTVNGKRVYELIGKFLDDLRENAFSGTNGEDAVEHIEYFLNIIDLIDLPNINYERLRIAVFLILLVGNASKWFDEFKGTKGIRDLTNTTFEEWLASKFANHMMMDPLTKKVFWKEEGYCNGGNFPGAFRVGNTLRCQDLEWYEALEDGKIKDEALQNKAIMKRVIGIDEESCDKAWRRWDHYENTTHNDEEREPKDGHNIGNLDYDLVGNNASYHTNVMEEEHKERCNLFNNTARDAPMCKIRRFEMIKYSFGQDEEFVAIKECEYDDLTRSNEDACRTYQ